MSMLILCLVALLLVDHRSGQGMPSQQTPASASCDTRCSYSEAKRRADCDNRQLSEVPMECNAASYLSLSHNQIVRIEPGTFEGFTNLQVLTLSNNRIRQVESNVFTGAPKLKEINLQSNNLRIIDRLALNGSSDLQDVYLSNNNINDIESETFQFVTKLKFIALYNNSLSSLNPGVFDNLRHLAVLDLGSNKLKTLPSDMFAHLSRLQTIILSDNQLISTGRVLLLPRITTLDMRNNNLMRLENLTEEALGRLQIFLLEGNPWNCDCQLETLRLWYSRLNSQGDFRTYVDSPTCSEPPTFAKQPINGAREVFCPKLNFSSYSTDSPKSTKGSSDEINYFTSPDTSEPNSPGESHVKVIVPVMFILAVTLISCALRYKRNWYCTSNHNLRSNTKTTDNQQSEVDSKSFPQSEQRTHENTLVGNGSVEGSVVELYGRDSESIINETTPMMNCPVEGAKSEATTHEKEQRTKKSTPTKKEKIEGTTVRGGKTQPVSFRYRSGETESEKVRKSLF
ncbi:uncharacterized protein [Diadema setosum]|uniref:uncharacterized protein n=1 Tax=Diadema setosum TaxID=31175 RepID=UPI003B3BB23C